MADSYVSPTQVVVGVSDDQIKRLNEQLATKNLEIDQLKETNTSLEQKCDTCQRELQEFKESHKSATENEKTMSVQLSQSNEERDALRQELDTLKASMTKMEE